MSYQGTAIGGARTEASVRVIPAAPLVGQVKLQGDSRPLAGYYVPLTVRLYNVPITGTNIKIQAPVATFSTTDGNMVITNTNVPTKQITLTVGALTPGGPYNVTLYSPHNLVNLKNGVTIAASGTSFDMGTLLEGDAQDITTLPVDVLKAEFPADLHYKQDKPELINLCHQLDMSSQVPWVILSGGVDFELFCQQVEIACQAGASGFLGGRAIWQEAMHIDNIKERVQYLSTVGVDRLKRLTEIASKSAVPWYKKFGVTTQELVEIPEGWYEEY